MTGTGETDLLRSLCIIDTSGASTKWRRIHHTFLDRQRQDKCANLFCAFAEAAAHPGRWTGRRDEYARFRENLNEALLLAGLRVGESGKMHTVAVATTLDESAERTNRLRAKLQQRNVHNEVLRFSK